MDIIDARSTRAPSAPRQLRDGREVELLRTYWEFSTSTRTGRQTQRMACTVREADSGQLLTVWHSQLRPLQTRPGATNPNSPTILDQRNLPVSDVVDTVPAFWARYNGVVEILPLTGINRGGSRIDRPDDQALARVVQRVDGPEDWLQTTTVYSPDGRPRQELVQWYRLRYRGELVVYGSNELRPLGGPGITWLWRSAATSPLRALEQKARHPNGALTPYEMKALGLELVVPTKPDMKYDGTVRSGPAVKTHLPTPPTDSGPATPATPDSLVFDGSVRGGRPVPERPGDPLGDDDTNTQLPTEPPDPILLVPTEAKQGDANDEGPTRPRYKAPPINNDVGAPPTDGPSPKPRRPRGAGKRGAGLRDGLPADPESLDKDSRPPAP